LNTTLISIVCKGKREKGFRVIKNPENLRFLIYKIFLHTKCGDFTWRLSDCEELLGVTHRR
jgi:hypothetical protein